MIRLYRHALSGHCHRVELFLSLIGLDHEQVDVDLPNGEHKTQDFLAKNAFGQVPVLVDGNVVVPDSNAILIYLAKQHAPAGWYPEAPEAAATVQRWLSVAAGEIAYGPNAARLVTVLGADLDHERAKAIAHNLLQTIDGHLAEHTWLAGAQPTIADVAGYSYIARAPEGEIPLEPYPNVTAWLQQIEALPGFFPMPANKVGLAA